VPANKEVYKRTEGRDEAAFVDRTLVEENAFVPDDQVLGRNSS
jgi:hypothetical protein